MFRIRTIRGRFYDGHPDCPDRPTRRRSAPLSFIVTAFIGKSGYKKTPQQFTNANSPGATPEAETAVVSNDTVPQKGTGVNSHSMQNSSEYASSTRQS